MGLDWWISCVGCGLVDQWVWSSKFCDFFFFFFFLRCDRCLKEEVGIAEMGRGCGCGCGFSCGCDLLGLI